MSRTAFIHVNGTTYPTTQEFDSEQDAGFQELARRISDLASGGHQFTVQVLIGGVPADLHLTTQGVFAGAAFLEKEKQAPPPRIVRGGSRDRIGGF